MAKKEIIMEENILEESPMVETLDVEMELSGSVVETQPQIEEKEYKVDRSEPKDGFAPCLRNERVIVRYVNKQSGKITDPRHIYYGGMAEGARRVFTVPLTASGMYAKILTDDEASYLECIMGLEVNALSVYRKINNFWDNSNDVGISKVELKKGDNFLDLSSPEGYIKYKILLANKMHIAENMTILKDYPKETYQFVMIAEGEEIKEANDGMTAMMSCYKIFGKLEDDVDTLRCIIESLTGTVVANTSKGDFLKKKCNELIQSNPKTFLAAASDKLLPNKVLIKKCLENGAISRKGDYLYLTQGNLPLCGQNEEPTLSVAARFLSLPKNQDMKFLLESKTK